MVLCPTLILRVVAIEKGAFGSASMKIAKFTYLSINKKKKKKKKRRIDDPFRFQ